MTSHDGTSERRGWLYAQYLEALGLPASPPTLAALDTLLSRHLARIPFASLSVRLQQPMPLALEAVFDRLVVQCRGGYCFEQNHLLQEMLHEAGYTTRLVLARVVYGQDTHPGLTHRLTLVTVDGEEWLVDAGFGAPGPRVSVPLSGAERVDGWRRFRVAECRAGEFHLQRLSEDGWFTLYRFELHRYGESDCELGHFYSHRHPDATFVNHLVAARLLPERILSLRGRDYRQRVVEGEHTRVLADATELHHVLTSDFGLRLEAAEAALLSADWA